MRIAWLQASHTHKRFNENMTVVDRHFGVFPDIGLATAAAVARAWGADVRIWDAYATQSTIDDVRAEMRAWGPDLLAAAFHAVPTWSETIDGCGQLKRALGIPLLLGGHEASRYPREVMSHAAVDYLLQGPASSTLPAFLDTFVRGRGWGKVPGLAWRTRAGVRLNRAPFDLSTAADPRPARDLLPVDRYYSHLTQRRHYTVLLTSRGCPHGCAFCAVARSPYEPRPVDDVVDEMRDCVDDLGIHEFDLFDPLLLHDRRRAMALCEAIRDARLDQEWACRSRVDDVDDALLRAMADAGCVRIYYGIESGDADVLRRIHKRISPDQIEHTIAATRDHGIRPLGFFQIGHPGETLDSARRTIEFALRLPLDYAQFMRTIAKPGSELEDQLRAATGTDPWRDHVLGRRDDARMPTPWTELPPPVVDALVKEAYLRFYTRPKVALRTLRDARSLDEVARYVGVGWKMLVRSADG